MYTHLYTHTHTHTHTHIYIYIYTFHSENVDYLVLKVEEDSGVLQLFCRKKSLFSRMDRANNVIK